MLDLRLFPFITSHLLNCKQRNAGGSSASTFVFFWNFAIFALHLLALAADIDTLRGSDYSFVFVCSLSFVAPLVSFAAVVSCAASVTWPHICLAFLEQRDAGKQ